MNKTKRLLISMLTLLCCCTGMWAESSSDVLNGVFTINNSGTRVQFSKGNLQYVNSTYQFAEHQYDYFGNNQDWFSYNNYSAPSDGISWYVMSQAEWEYLFVSRTVTNTLSEGARYSKATIGGTYKGVIVFPDNYTHPDGTGFEGNCENATEAYSSIVSLEGWALMEAAGCVFLPAAGYSTNSGQINKAAIYQSTTSPRSGYYNTPGFYIDYMDMTDQSQTSTGVPVRFVKKYLTYHLIGSAQELKDFATLVNSGTTSANAKLTTDIDLAGDDANQWTPIGTDANRYSGTFDGQGFTIKNLYYNQQVEGVGLFGFANTDAYIKNVRVEGMIDNYTGNSGAQTGAGGIIGISDGATVLNCSFSGSVISYSNVGGIVGYGTATIVNCYNEGTVTFHSTSNQAGGGVHGYGGSPQLKNCYNVGSVINNGSSTYAIGSLSYSGSVSNCYSRSGCVQNGGGASWSNAGNYGTAMSLDDMKTEAFVTTLNTNVASLRAAYPDICEWTLNSDGYPVHANRQITYTVPSSGIGTFSNAFKFTVPEGLTAHYCKTYNAEKSIISVVNINGAVPANTGVVLKGEPGKTYTLAGTNSEAATITDNALVAVTEATHVNQTEGDYTNFMMSGGKFIIIAANNDPEEKMPANRAYLKILTSELPSGQSRTITLSWDDATDISTTLMNKGELIMNNSYDLQGRRINGLPTTKGLYIVNGRKVVIK